MIELGRQSTKHALGHLVRLVIIPVVVLIPCSVDDEARRDSVPFLSNTERDGRSFQGANEGSAVGWDGGIARTKSDPHVRHLQDRTGEHCLGELEVKVLACEL